MWVYIESERYQGNVTYTVGFYDPAGEFQPDEDFPGDRQAARDRVHYLNGGQENSAACPHGNPRIDCAKCDHEADLAHDTTREDRTFGRNR